MCAAATTQTCFSGGSKQAGSYNTRQPPTWLSSECRSWGCKTRPRPPGPYTPGAPQSLPPRCAHLLWWRDEGAGGQRCAALGASQRATHPLPSSLPSLPAEPWSDFVRVRVSGMTSVTRISCIRAGSKPALSEVVLGCGGGCFGGRWRVATHLDAKQLQSFDNGGCTTANHDGPGGALDVGSKLQPLSKQEGGTDAQRRGCTRRMTFCATSLHYCSALQLLR
jgi:hypothetical protein